MGTILLVHPASQHPREVLHYLSSELHQTVMFVSSHTRFLMELQRSLSEEGTPFDAAIFFEKIGQFPEESGPRLLREMSRQYARPIPLFGLSPSIETWQPLDNNLNFVSTARPEAEYLGYLKNCLFNLNLPVTTSKALA